MGIANSKDGNIDDSTTILIVKDQNQKKISFPNSISTLILTNKTLNELPSNLPNVTSIILSFNEYSSIPDTIYNSFVKYPQLKSVDFSYNYIDTININFLDINTLKRLHFYHNNLSTFPQSKEFPHIAHLDIGKNKFKKIPVCFPNLISLMAGHNYIQSIDYQFSAITKMILTHNSISKISPQLSFPSLFLLDISHNKLEELPDFCHFAPNLKTLDASYNSIQTIPKMPISIIRIFLQHNKISNLQNFFTSNVVISNLSFNEIETLEELPPFLEKLDISHNKIHLISPIISDNISSINFSNNLIESIPSTTFSAQLFSFNKISVLSECFFNSITLLDISGNNLKELPPSIFSIESLFTILASFNNLQTLPVEAFNSNIRKLNLSFNPLSPTITFPQNIESLYLDYCNLSEIPSINLNSKELVELSVVGNKLRSINNLIPKHIEFLNVSYNQIESINLTNLKRLRYLDLSFNLIKDIQFLNGNFPALFYLDFSSNPIDFGNHDSIFANMPKLSFLIMENIRQLPDLANISKLRCLNTTFPVELTSKKVHFSSFNTKNKYISYSNYIGLNEKDENYIFNIDLTSFSLYSIFKDYEMMNLYCKPMINQLNNEMKNGFNIDFINSFFNREILSRNKQLSSHFVLIFDRFVDLNKFVAVIFGQFQILSIGQNGEICELTERIEVDTFIDEIRPQIVELSIPKNTKYLLAIENISLDLISVSYLSNLSSKSNNSSEFSLALKTVISTFDRFHNFSSLVIDIPYSKS